MDKTAKKDSLSLSFWDTVFLFAVGSVIFLFSKRGLRLLNFAIFLFLIKSI